MSRYGTGFPAGRRRKPPADTNPIATIQPSAQWDGSPGSGFSNTPSDPARTSAKPALQLLVPPLQRFTDKITVGVLAIANHRESMFDRLGLDRVRVHYEGTVHDITAPTVQPLTDAHDNDRFYWGWWIELERSGIDGEAQVYFEAIPRNNSMQSRVIGPHSFFPASQLYDFEVEVAPSQPVIADQRYQSIKAAAESLRVRGADHARITVTEPGNYDLTPVNGAYAGKGYCTIEATTPITIAKDSYVASSTSPATNGLMRLKYDGLWLRGQNITIDTADLRQFYHENPSNPQHVFDGVTITDSKGRGALWLKGRNPLPYITRNTPYYLECSVSVTQNAFNNASLVRGCSYDSGAQDAFSYARCVTSCTLTNHHNQDWRTPIDAISITYAGNAASATIELSGGSDTNNRVVTLKEDGSIAGTFQIKSDDAGYVSGTHYHVSNVVDWLNSVAGWSATLLDDSRRAAALSHSSANTLGNAFSAVEVNGSPIILHTVFDPHGDAWAMNSKSAENSLFFGNLMYANVLPCIFLNQTGLKDIFIVNNTGQTDENLNPDFATMASQWSKSSSHVVIAHNSLANQKLLLRTGIGLTADDYCLLANNTMADIEWVTTPDANLVIADNHLHGGASEPDGAVNTSFAGDGYSLFANAAIGDFTPTNQLRSELKRAVVHRDRTLIARSTSSPTGAVA